LPLGERNEFISSNNQAASLHHGGDTVNIGAASETCDQGNVPTYQAFLSEKGYSMK